MFPQSFCCGLQRPAVQIVCPFFPPSPLFPTLSCTLPSAAFHSSPLHCPA